jgi:hypothetical protein
MKFEYTKGVFRIRKSKDRQHNDRKNKQRSTNHYTENQRSSNTNPTKNRGELRYPGGLKRMWTSLYCTASSLCLLGGAIITILNMLNKDCTQNFMQQFSAEEGCNLIQCVIKVIK